ncbi:MAG: ferredoxin--NADP reductase [Rhodospirillaceae bacterium]|nr:ferredoxin--NADP reductase [Rhodospirillaceae bacterium]
MSTAEEDDNDVGVVRYRLTVRAVREETSEARSFVLVPDRVDKASFVYRPGQFLTFRVPHEDGDIARSYSLSSAPATDPDMTVCVKRVADGRGSNWFHDRLISGARIEATAPSGRFVLRDSKAPLFVIAGGSGITPCISIIKQALVETGRQVKLVYANQCADAVIYRSTLDTLEARFGDRFTCRHWLDDERGFLTSTDVTAAVTGWEQADCYICGPDPLMDMAEETLFELLGEDARVLTERFLSPDDPAPADETDAISATTGEAFVDGYRLTLDGEDHTVPISGDETLLQAALKAGIDAPCSCTEGHCGSCIAWLRSGDVTMNSTQALSKRNMERGYVLACQSRPSSPTPVWLDLDL